MGGGESDIGGKAVLDRPTITMSIVMFAAAIVTVFPSVLVESDIGVGEIPSMRLLAAQTRYFNAE